MELFQRAKSGKVKYKKIYTEGATLITEWGTQCSDKEQRVEKICKAKNVGKANELSAVEQAQAEADAKITKELKKGYVKDLEAVNATAVVEIDLANLPDSFCPCKPDAGKNMKKGFIDHKDTYGQRKRDGHCIILVKTEAGDKKIYSRGMKELTSYLSVLPVVSDFLTSMGNGSMIFTEMCFIKLNGKDCTRKISNLTAKKDPVEVLSRYEEALKAGGQFEIVPFDIMYADNIFVGDKNYLQRKELLNSFTNVPEVSFDWKDKLEAAEEAEWEGFVLRNDTLGSKIHYSLNGKADKAGSYKYVFTETADFVVVSADHGKSGRHAKYYAKFYLSQYRDDQLVEYGNCGPGNLKEDDLVELKERIDGGELSFPFVVEIEFRARHLDSGKLVFPVLQRLREDKRIEECIADYEEEE